MNIFITGGLGFVGRHLTEALLAQGHEVTVTGTRKDPPVPRHVNFRYLPADTTRQGIWQQAAARAQVAVNLAGRNIFKRWGASYKQQIYDSRILTTRHLVTALSGAPGTTLISTSAVGIYGNRGDDLLEETEAPGDDFLARLSRDWEAAALAAEEKGIRVAITRFGIILGTDGGALARMLPAFKFFLGGPVGSGRQWVSWIHIRDVVNAIIFLAEHPECSGKFNFSAPEPIRYRELAAALGKALGRPSSLRTPAVALRIALGELGEVILGSQRAVPRRLTAAGYDFRFKDINTALSDLTAAVNPRQGPGKREKP